MKNKLLIALLLATAFLCAVGNPNTQAGELAKAPVAPVAPQGQVDELWLDAFASYNFGGAADPWAYGIGATFFPGAGSIGFGVDYAYSGEAQADENHRLNVGATYRLPITDNMDVYGTGFAGFLTDASTGIDTFGNDTLNDVFSYGARAGIRFAPLANTPVAVFTDFGRTWDDGGAGYNTARAGLSIFF